MAIPTPPITRDMTVETVLRTHPAMLQAFLDAGFKPLANPLLRKLLAGVVSLSGAARKKGWDEARLTAFIAQLERIRETVPVTVGEAPPEELEGEVAHERHPWGLFVDNRGLEPPQPMMRIMSLIETLGPGERLEAHNDREPVMLLPRLPELGFDFKTAMQPDGTCRITIWRADDATR